MRATARATEAYLLVAMLTAAAAGRELDAAGLLPGVHEAGSVRSSGGAWSTALLAAALVAMSASRRWSRTRRLASTAAVVLPGQLLVFFCAEAAPRVATGRAPVDPDALVGASLQAALAGLLLLALSVTAAVVLQCAPLSVQASLPPRVRVSAAPRVSRPRRGTIRVEARGPPAALGC